MHNIIAFERDAKHAGRGGGTLLRRGQFAPGFPFAYVADPDGYEIEIWFE
jgi:catechol 2,3-dioxygenase-like lactoylglutathione lyase family enzyme